MLFSRLFSFIRKQVIVQVRRKGRKVVPLGFFVGRFFIVIVLGFIYFEGLERKAVGEIVSFTLFFIFSIFFLVFVELFDFIVKILR